MFNFIKKNSPKALLIENELGGTITLISSEDLDFDVMTSGDAASTDMVSSPKEDLELDLADCNIAGNSAALVVIHTTFPSHPLTASIRTESSSDQLSHIQDAQHRCVVVWRCGLSFRRLNRRWKI